MKTECNTVSTHGLAGLARAAVLALGAIPTAGALGSQTPITEVVMYTVNNDGNPATLLRFNFDSEYFDVIGGVVDANGVKYKNVECLTYIPEGDHKGFYGADNGPNETRSTTSRIIKIDHFTGTAVPRPNLVGFGYVVGMIPWQKPTGEWVIYATQLTWGPGVPYVRRFLEINPETGVGTLLTMLLNSYEGLAIDANGDMYGVRPRTGITTDELWKITLPANGQPKGEAYVGNTGYSHLESLEFAIGDNLPQIDLPQGYLQNLTSAGLLLAYSDDADTFLIISRQNGKAYPYTPPFQPALATSDVEGIVFFTKLTDPCEFVYKPFD